MKRLCCIAAALALCLTGCAVTAPDTPETPTATTAATTTGAAPTESTTTMGTTAPTASTSAATAAPTDPTTSAATSEATTATTTAPTAVTTTVVTTKKRPSYKMEFDLFADNTRKNGMIYTHVYDSHQEAPFSWSSNRPQWLYTQVGRYHVVDDGTFETPAPGVYYHESPVEQLYVDTNTGLVKMNIFGSNYFEHTRRPDEGFSGMLLTPLELTGRVYVKDITSLNVKLDFLLEKVECHIPDGELDMAIHTIGWYYYVFICDNYSTDWFYVGLPFYDWRTGNYPDDATVFDKDYLGIDPYTGAGGQQGTPVFIPATDRVFGEGNRNRLGERFTCDVDILPYVKEAFEKIQAAGRFQGRSLDTFYVQGCNLGWEIPGTFDGWATVYRYEMTYTE